MSLQDSFNENDGVLNAMGHLAAINQRNRQIEQQKEQAEAIRKQTAELEKANKIEADRVEIEKQRLKIEKQRLKSEQLKQELERNQAKQVRQLRNLLADGFEMLERLGKAGATAAAGDALTRQIALLQANLGLLESQSDALSDLSDMKELRSFRLSLEDFIATRSSQGELPGNPLMEVKRRLEGIARFFAEADAELDKRMEWKSEWLDQVPRVTHAELREAGVELAALEAGLSVLAANLRQMVSPLDWHGPGDSMELHPELLLIAQSSGVRLLPGEDSGEPTSGIRRLQLIGLVHEGSDTMNAIRSRFTTISKRIAGLTDLHARHLRLAGEALDHLAKENFHSAEMVKSQMGEGRFADIDYAAMDAAFRKQQDLLDRYRSLESGLAERLAKGEQKAVGAELDELRGMHFIPSSELAAETTSSLAKAEATFGLFISRRKRTRMVAVFVIAVALLAGASLSLYLVEENRKAEQRNAEAKAAKEAADKALAEQREIEAKAAKEAADKALAEQREIEAKAAKEAADKALAMQREIEAKAAKEAADKALAEQREIEAKAAQEAANKALAEQREIKAKAAQEAADKALAGQREGKEDSKTEAGARNSPHKGVIFKPSDKHGMPVYSFAERKRIARTEAYYDNADNNGLKKGINATGTLLRYNNDVRSAAADWSFYPVGTIFRIDGLPYDYVIDDYSFSMVGTGSIGIYTPTNKVKDLWGVRTVKIEVTHWGSFTRSAEILSGRTDAPKCEQMLENLIRQRPDLKNVAKQKR